MGFKIDKYAQNIVSAYDKNADGKVDVNKENTRTAITSETETNALGDEYTERYRDTFSSGNLFKTADANKDGQVTKGEMADLLKKYDKNKNGTLDGSLVGTMFPWVKSEVKAFAEEYPEPRIKRERE